MIQPEPFANSDPAVPSAAGMPLPHPLPAESDLAAEWPLEAPAGLSVDALETADADAVRQQFLALHRQIQQQQAIIHSLSEQLSSRDGRLQKLEETLDVSQCQCRRQTDQLEELEAVCQDLRSQLRRQQQRTSQYMQALTQQTAQPLDPVASDPIASKTYMAFAYEAITVTTQSQPLAKTPPVPTWSAADITHSLSLYQKLAAMSTEQPSANAGSAARRQRLRLKQPYPKGDCFEQSFTLAHGASAPTQVELPSFTRSQRH